MCREIERKFLVSTDAWRVGATGTPIRQGYLSAEFGRSVRVRTAGEAATLTIKGKKVGRTAPEFEYAIPLDHARQMLDQLCLRPLIDKTRFRVEHPDGHVWEIDEFHGDNLGLIVAELELTTEEEAFDVPEWLGEEVTDDLRYLNYNLVARPYGSWGE